MTDFLTADTNLPSYMMFPRFLLDMEINETAKMLYIILLDRARISQKNEGWSDIDGHVFIYFTIEALAEVLHKSQMTVKTALAVLEKQELIFRKRQGPGQPNRIYVKLPKETIHYTDRFLSLRQTENCPIDRQDSFPDTDRKLSGNKKEIKKNHLAIRGSKEPRSPYGKFQNVFLSEKELQPDEYFNETDHLIYCSKCNTPRQCRHELQGKVLIPSIRCKCQQEIFEQEEAQRKLHEKQMEIEHLKTSGLQDKALYDYTFTKDNGINPEIKLAHNYVSNWEEMKANASGLLIWGDGGTGKSFFAGCIANALLEKGVPVLMTNFSRILNTLTGMHFEDRNQFINSLNRYSLLIIDDLGIERNSDFALEQVFHVIDSRYRSKKPLIITTNLTLSELNNAADIAHKRIYDRILERCVPIRINNRNIRQDNAVANLKQAKKILLDNHAPNQNGIKEV